MKKQVYVNPKFSAEEAAKKPDRPIIGLHNKQQKDQAKLDPEKQRGLEIHEQNQKSHQDFKALQKQVRHLSNTAKNKLGINTRAYKPNHFIPDEVFFTDEPLDTAKSLQIKVDPSFIVIDGITIITSKIVSIDADSRVVLIKLEGGSQEMIFTQDQTESDNIISILHKAIQKYYCLC